LQDFNLWEGYWTDPTHGDIRCYATGCPYNPNGAGVTFKMKNIDEFQCVNNEWTHKGITLKDSSGNVIYCRQFNTCGDRNIDGDEECDDGNRLEGDGCSIDCKNE